jgi:hypothetical protein
MSSTRTSDLIINDGTSTTAPTKSLELQNSISSIVLGNNINTTPVFTTISPTAITQGANSISLQNLTLLPTVLASVELPPNATTLKINDTILVDAGIANQTTTINDGNITITGTGAAFASDFSGLDFSALRGVIGGPKFNPVTEAKFDFNSFNLSTKT